MSGKYALIIGNTEYIDPGLAELTAPGKDTEDFARILKAKDFCAFDDVKILFNQLSSSVIESIDEFFDQRKPDDMLILYFSGHGVRDEMGSLYLAVKNTIRSRLRSTAIRTDYIREAMDQSRSKRQVLILDCCNSGAFPQGTKAEVGGMMGMTRAFQGYGRFVLTASDATQFAWEGDKVIGQTENSLFTHFLVKGLEGEADSDGDGKITVDELYDYAYDQISRVTPKQTPTKSSSKQEGEIILRQITRLEDIRPVSLPEDLIEATQDSRTFVREGAIRELEKLLNGKNLGLARSAREALERMEREDDSRRVSQAATMALESVRKSETEQKVKREFEQLLAEQKANGEIERLSREEEHVAKAKVEADRRPAEPAEADRRAQEQSEQLFAKPTEEEEQKVSVEGSFDEPKERAQPPPNEKASPPEQIVSKPSKTEAKRARSSFLPLVIGGGVLVGLVVCGYLGIRFLSTIFAGPSMQTPTQVPAATEAPVTERPLATEPASTPTRVDTITCAGSQPGDKLSILYSWGVPEQGRLTQILKPLVDNCGIELILEAATDPSVLDARVAAGDPPDVSFTYLAQLNQYQNQLVPVDELGASQSAYIPGATDFGVIGGKWLGLPLNSYIMSLVWYSPMSFEAAGYSVPITWDELNELVAQMVNDGNVPWSMGLESGGATGWTGAHFIQDLVLVQQGPTYVKGILDGTIPYNDDGVAQAYATYADWALDPTFALGGAEGTLSTGFLDAIYRPFSDPPEAMMVRQASFAEDEIKREFPGLEFGTGYNFFVIPGAQSLQANSDFMIAFSDTPAVRALVTYLSSPEGAVNWAKTGFGLSPNKAAAGHYTDPSLKKKAEAFYSTQGLTPTFDAIIGGNFSEAQRQAVVDYLSGADLQSVLSEVAAAQAEALNP